MALYRELYRIIIRHNYYTSGASQDFLVLPTDECVTNLSRMGMIFKVIGNELVMLGESIPDGADYKMKREIPDDTKFTFMLVNKGPGFLNYTHLPLDYNLHKMYYLCNLYDHQDAGELLLYPANTGHFVDEEERLTLYPEIFTMNFTTATQVKITDADTGTVIFNASVTGAKEFDFSGSKSKKRYNVEFDSSGNVDLVFYVDNFLVSQQRLFGIAEIYKSSLVPSAYRFINNTTGIIQNKNYTMRFNKRSAKWRYILEIKYDQQLKDDFDSNTLDIGVTSVLENFTETSSSYPNIPRVVTFESNDQIAFSTDPLKGVKLENDISGSPVTVKNNLPNASTAMVQPSPGYIHGSPTDDLVYSEIFIYV